MPSLLLLDVRIAQLGEGGYAFVYLAKELPTSERPSAASDGVAIKKVTLQLAPLPDFMLWSAQKKKRKKDSQRCQKKPPSTTTSQQHRQQCHDWCSCYTCNCCWLSLSAHSALALCILLSQTLNKSPRYKVRPSVLQTHNCRSLLLLVRSFQLPERR
jgi:hypothetical protein